MQMSEIPTELYATRAKAREEGMQLYWDPVHPCPHHGQAVRWASSGRCKECYDQARWKKMLM